MASDAHVMRTHGKHLVTKEQNEKHKKMLEKMLQREENRCVPRPRRERGGRNDEAWRGEGNQGVSNGVCEAGLTRGANDAHVDGADTARIADAEDHDGPA